MTKNIVSDSILEYYKHVSQTQTEILKYETPKIEIAAQKIVEALKNGNKIWGYGTSHASEFIQALIAIPNTIPFISPVLSSMEGVYDNVEGLGILLAEQVDFKKGDVFIFVSISGKHPLTMEIIQYLKDKGVYTIGVTSVTYSGSSKPNNKWNVRLYEAADLFFDNHVGIGDACVTVEGIEETVGPISGVMSMFITELLIAALAEEFEKQKVDFSVWRHPHLKGSTEHNKKVIEQASQWVNYFKN